VWDFVSQKRSESNLDVPCGFVAFGSAKSRKKVCFSVIASGDFERGSLWIPLLGQAKSRRLVFGLGIERTSLWIVDRVAKSHSFLRRLE